MAMTSIKTNVEDRSRFATYCDLLSVVSYFLDFLIMASVYSQSGYETYNVGWVLLAAVVISASYFTYRVFHDYEFLNYFLDFFYKSYSKTLFSRLIAIFTLVFLIARFLLPSQIVFYLQNTLYIGAFVYLIIGMAGVRINMKSV